MEIPTEIHVWLLFVGFCDFFGSKHRELANAEKTKLIDALREAFSLKELLKNLDISKSSYFYQRKVQALPSKYTDLRIKVKELFRDNQARYGYRRIHVQIKGNGNIVLEKVIRRIEPLSRNRTENSS